MQWGRKLRRAALSCVKVTPSRESCLEALGSRWDWALTHRPDVCWRGGCSLALLPGRPAPLVTGLRAARAHVLWVPAAMETQGSRGCSVFLQNPVAIRPFICRAGICRLADLGDSRTFLSSLFPPLTGLLVGNPTPRGLASKRGEQDRREGPAPGGEGSKKMP